MKKFIPFLAFILLCNFLYAQDTINNIKIRNNALKGMIIGVSSGYVISLSYERNISKHGTLELYFRMAEDGAPEGDASKKFMGAILSYRYYFLEQKPVNIWTSMYSPISSYDSGDDSSSQEGNIYGLGIAAGSRMFFTKRKKLFLDLGLGSAYTILIFKKSSHKNIEYNSNGEETITWDTTLDSPQKSWRPRFILHLGFKF